MMAAAMAANFVVCKSSFARNSALLRGTACKCMKSTKASKNPSGAVAASNGGDARTPKKSASAANAVKKFNFENLSLYGPVLRSSKGTKLDKGLRLSYLDERAPRRLKVSRLACEEPETARVVRAGERLFRNQLEAELLDALTSTDEEAARLAAASGDAEQKVDVSIPTKSFDLEATLNFPLLNFLRDGVPEDDDTHVAVPTSPPQDEAQGPRKAPKGEMVLIDWKTSKKQKPRLSDTYDNPLQVAAYVGALNYDGNYKIQVRDAMIVIAYEDGSPCQVHHLGPTLCQRHWQRWLQRVRTYWNQLNQSTAML
ncbi:hypothetical protein HPB51_003750 [Rhipicephalus microplus]|uniref:Mitochondrial genome maintenance exonuclease 1 n=1 Tax=Rhipicephalus microplus TaxID=6941 RepID=A0A9J6DYF7_RHIMP|nr:hypothetical protein HPB51_003750 [Rhipicephalus microplus]